MKRVAHQIPTDDRGRLRERPADDSDREAVRAQNRPERARAERRRRMRLLDEESEAHETAREAETRKELDRFVAPGDLIVAGGADAVLLRQLSRRDRRPHRFRRCRMQRRQMAHRAGVEQPSEVRQAAFGRRARDEVERSPVDRDDDDAGGTLGFGCGERRVDWPRFERRRFAAAAQRDRRRDRRRGNQQKHRHPRRARTRSAAVQHGDDEAARRGRRECVAAANDR